MPINLALERARIMATANALYTDMTPSGHDLAVRILGRALTFRALADVLRFWARTKRHDAPDDAAAYDLLADDCERIAAEHAAKRGEE